MADDQKGGSHLLQNIRLRQRVNAHWFLFNRVNAKKHGYTPGALRPSTANYSCWGVTVVVVVVSFFTSGGGVVVVVVTSVIGA